MKKPRTTALRVRLTPDEHEAVSVAGLERGLGICSFARMAVVTAAGRKPTKPPRRKPDAFSISLANWTTELSRIGNLLNQVARAANTGFDVDPGLVNEVRDELAQLRASVLTTVNPEIE